MKDGSDLIFIQTIWQGSLKALDRSWQLREIRGDKRVIQGDNRMSRKRKKSSGSNKKSATSSSKKVSSSKTPDKSDAGRRGGKAEVSNLADPSDVPDVSQFTYRRSDRINSLYYNWDDHLGDFHNKII